MTQLMTLMKFGTIQQTIFEPSSRKRQKGFVHPYLVEGLLAMIQNLIGTSLKGNSKVSSEKKTNYIDQSITWVW
jgi:hypothetical protein